MANPNPNQEGLRHINDRPDDEQYAIRSAGGRAGSEARRRKKSLRLALEALLESDIKLKNGGTKSGAEALAAKLFEKGLNGDVRAFETIRSTVGQDPVQKVMVADVDQATIDEVEKAVLGAAESEDQTE